MDKHTFGHAELIVFLKEQGHSRLEVMHVLEKLQKREASMEVDVLMESIGNGSFDISSLLSNFKAGDRTRSSDG
jgi:uncharacterized cupredoxin-like copper-binding protein